MALRRRRATKKKRGKISIDPTDKINSEHVRALADVIAYCIFLGFIFCVVFLNPAEYHANKIITGFGQLLDNAEVKLK